MRGLVLWTLIALLILAVELVFLIENVFGAVDQAAEMNNVLNGEHIAGIINLMQSSPAGTVHAYNIPKGKCIVKISPGNVNFTNTEKIGSPKYYAKGYARLIDADLNSAVTISEDFFELECSRKTAQRIFFKNCGDEIKVSQSNEINC
ncbi:MAG TPA: hypothetical protein VI968_00435 [archaeon]|nr:hypothetical protein [archaeon]